MHGRKRKEKTVVMVFDAGDEKFRVIPLPYRCIDFTIEGIAELS